MDGVVGGMGRIEGPLRIRTEGVVAELADRCAFAEGGFAGLVRMGTVADWRLVGVSGEVFGIKAVAG